MRAATPRPSLIPPEDAERVLDSLNHAVYRLTRQLPYSIFVTAVAESFIRCCHSVRICIEDEGVDVVGAVSRRLAGLAERLECRITVCLANMESTEAQWEYLLTEIVESVFQTLHMNGWPTRAPFTV